MSSPDDKKKKDKPKEEKEVDKAAGELDNNTVALIRARYVVSFFLGGEGGGFMYRTVLGVGFEGGSFFFGGEGGLLFSTIFSIENTT